MFRCLLLLVFFVGFTAAEFVPKPLNEATNDFVPLPEVQDETNCNDVSFNCFADEECAKLLPPYLTNCNPENHSNCNADCDNAVKNLKANSIGHLLGVKGSEGCTCRPNQKSCLGYRKIVNQCS